MSDYACYPGQVAGVAAAVAGRTSPSFVTPVLGTTYFYENGQLPGEVVMPPPENDAATLESLVKKQM